MKVLCVIPARYASTRLPGKPLSLICGKPMIQRVYERACQAQLPDEVVVATDNELVNELREDIYESVKGIDERLSVHDFRLVPGVTHTNLIFDVFVPFEVTTGDEELRSLINAKVKSISTGYHTVITFDRG